MREMNLGGAPKENTGHDIPGMVSVYMVRLPDGMFLSPTGTAEREWIHAKLLCGFVGLLEAKELAQTHGGTVCIVNCTSVQVYQD